MTRREWLVLSASALTVNAATTAPDRERTVRRNNPVIRKIDENNPLSVGNGAFAFTVDVTGLQSIPAVYEKTTPLCTMTEWAWHSYPRPNGPSELELEPYEVHGRDVGYPTHPNKGQQALFDWLRQNPHRFHVGRVGFVLEPADLSDIEQTLDLWTGLITSKFKYRGKPVTVITACHPSNDIIAVSVQTESPLDVLIVFPFPSAEMNGANWMKSEAHKTSYSKTEDRRASIERQIGAEIRYNVGLRWNGAVKGSHDGIHSARLTGNGNFDFVFAFSQKKGGEKSLAAAGDVFKDTAAHWAKFWSTGGAIDFSNATDPRAPELERRVVLSQYLTAIQCSGTTPPQETGLTCNSWYGKFHLEMHWWHAAHFALWGRTPMLERSLDWYSQILGSAKDRAKQQGYAGVRWPKMTSPDGRDSPSPIGPLLIWQQPHPIYFAELIYQAHPDRKTLDTYRELVTESADFMASYAWLNPNTQRYDLGPPMIPAQENHPPRDTWNPTFELEYWHFALGLAGEWAKRLEVKANPKWEEVRAKLAPLPVAEGVYLAHANCPQTYTERNKDHPSMLAAMGMLPGAMADRETMSRTLKRVLKDWKWAETWGWDYPMAAMTAARVGEPELAVDALLLDTPKNKYGINGHNFQRAGLPLYLPGNGGLLAAIAVMAKHDAFPKAKWDVRHEGLRGLPV